MEYAKAAARELFVKKKKVSWLMINARTTFTFLRNYLFKLDSSMEKVVGRLQLSPRIIPTPKYSLLKRMNGGDMSCCD
jgi:hypothetical protein